MTEPSYRVVIADDSPDDRREIRHLLLTGSDARYEFVECESAADVLRLVLESPSRKPDCLVLDFFLPDMDATELLPALQTIDGLTACPVLVITGRAGSSHGREVLRLGAQDFIGKEWLTAAALWRSVENSIERWNMAHELFTSRRALMARERELQSLANNSPDVLTRFDRGYRHVFANSAVTRITGRALEEILGRTNRALGMDDELCDRWEAALGRVFDGGAPEEIEFTLNGADGPAHFASRIVPEFDADGRIEHVLGVTRDITQLRQDALTARESAQRLQMALTAAQAGAWSWDIRSGALDWSAEMYVLFGRSPTLGPPSYAEWLEALHPDDRAAASDAVRDTLSRTVTEFRSEFRVLRPYQNSRWMLGIGKAEFDAAGDAVRMVGINLDIHDRKQMEAALRDDDVRKDEFLATLAHELRNPLAPLSTGLEVLRRAPAGATVTASVLGIMERQVGHLARLVDDLMDVSRIRSGKIDLKVEVVSIGDVVRQAIEACQSLIDRAQHRLSVVVEPAQILVAGDEVRLIQVLTNVLNNAVKYTPNSGQIDIQARIDTGEAMVRVVDDGVGIAPDMLSKVFDTFTQIDTTRHRAGGGLGVGLSLVRTLVGMHGGTVKCESRGLGLGTTVEVRLPLLVVVPDEIGGGADSALVRDGTVTGDEGRRILLIDDNIDGAETMATMLRLSGYQVSTAYDGAAGLAAASAVRPAVMVVDIGLPLMDGYEVARRVRADPALRDVRLIALTGWGTARDKDLSLQAGFDAHCTKPVDVIALSILLAAPARVEGGDRAPPVGDVR